MKMDKKNAPHIRKRRGKNRVSSGKIRVKTAPLKH
jgi:hypothetical protein